MTDIMTDSMTALPELILAVGALALLMLGVFSDAKVAYSRVTTGATLVMIFAGYMMLTAGLDATHKLVAFANMFVTDSFAVFMKTLVVIGSVTALLMSGSFLKDHNIDRFEYPVLIVLATLGMFMMISANSLMSLYVGLELQSLSLYVLAAINRDRNRSTEAGLKYFVLGALSSGMLLYGISLVYGFSGTIDFDDLNKFLVQNDGTSIGLILV